MLELKLASVTQQKVASQLSAKFKKLGTPAKQNKTKISLRIKIHKTKNKEEEVGLPSTIATFMSADRPSHFKF